MGSEMCIRDRPSAASVRESSSPRLTDGELTRTVWASRGELDSLTLAAEGTIARALIDYWADTPHTPHTPTPEGAHPWR